MAEGMILLITIKSPSPFEVLCLYSGAFNVFGVMPLVGCLWSEPRLNSGYSHRVVCPGRPSLLHFFLNAQDTV